MENYVILLILFFDSEGHHQLCCKQRTNNTSARVGAHNLVASVISNCAWRAGLKSSADANSIPALKEGSQEKGDLKIEYRIPNPRPRDTRGTFTVGFIGDTAIVHPRIGASSDPSQLGKWVPERLKSRAAKKTKKYSAYSEQNWVFLPLITSTYCGLSDTTLRLLYFLAELETDHAMHYECLGDNPNRVFHLLASRSRSRVACAVAVGTAMRLFGSSQDILGPRFRGNISSARIEHFVDEPLFPLGSEDCPFFSAFPLARGDQEYVQGYDGDGSLENLLPPFSASGGGITVL